MRNALVALTLVAGTVPLIGCEQHMTDVQPAQVMLTGPGSIAVGDQAQFSVVVTDENGAVLSGVSIDWATDNPAVATVDQNGLVTALGSGSGAVTATTGEVTGTASFRVAAFSFCKDDDHLDAWCRLTDSPTTETFPSVSGNRVVWVDQRTSSSRVIVMLDLATGDTTSLTPESEASTLPTLDGDRVIYARIPPAGNWPLLVYDLTTGVETPFATAGEYLLPRLALSGHRAAWHDNRNNNWDIYTFDFNTNLETRLTTDTSSQLWPAIFGDRVTWMDYRHHGTWQDLYTYDFTTGTETRLTEASTLGRGSPVSADRIVWGDIRGGQFSLYEYDFNRPNHERPLNTTLLSSEITMNGSRVAWTDVVYDIRAFDFTTGTEVRVTNNPGSARYPWISQDYLVWTDYRNGNADVYIARLVDVFRP